MQARSVLWSLGTIGDCIGQLDEQPVLKGNPITIDQGNRARQTARELVELLRGVSCARPSNPTERTDEALREVLAAMYRTGSADVATVSKAVTSEQIDRLRSEGYVETVHGELFVQLDDPDTARNWPPLVHLLVEVLGRQVRRTQTLLARLSADGDRGTEYALLCSLRDRLDCLRTVLRSHLGRLRLVNHTVSIDADLSRVLAETLPGVFGAASTTTEGS